MNKNRVWFQGLGLRAWGVDSGLRVKGCKCGVGCLGLSRARG